MSPDYSANANSQATPDYLLLTVHMHKCIYMRILRSTSKTTCAILMPWNADTKHAYHTLGEPCTLSAPFNARNWLIIVRYSARTHDSVLQWCNTRTTWSRTEGQRGDRRVPLSPAGISAMGDMTKEPMPLPSFYKRLASSCLATKAALYTCTRLI